MDWNYEEAFERIRDLEQRMKELEAQMKEQADKLDDELRKSGWK